MTPYNKNQDFLVYSYIRDGYKIKNICRILGINKKTIQNYLTSLKNRGLIAKIDYGVWKITELSYKKEVLKTPRDTLNTLELSKTSFKPDTVRGHAFIFKFEIPKSFRNWDKRANILDSLKIPYKSMYMFGGAQQIEVKGCKVWLTSKSIVINLKDSYFAETSIESKSYAVNDVLEIIKDVEQLIKANLGKYRFKICRNHYALIKNSLAKQYDREGKKLIIADDGGYWFLIDNSFNLHEAETVHPKTAEQDNKTIQDFFNDLKKNPITPSLLMQVSYQNAENLNSYAEHLKAHVESVQDLGKGVRVMNEKIGEFSRAIDLLTKTINKN